MFLRIFVVIIVLIINYLQQQYNGNFYDKYKKWHKRDFASSHKTWHSSWLTKQKVWFKKQQKEHLFRFDMVSNTHTFWKNFIFRKIIFWLYHSFL